MYSQVQVPIPIHGNTKSQFNLLVDYLKVSSIGTWKFMLIVDIMHKQQNWYLYNIHDRFRYHQKMLVLARYRYRYQNWCSPNSFSPRYCICFVKRKWALYMLIYKAVLGILCSFVTRISVEMSLLASGRC